MTRTHDLAALRGALLAPRSVALVGVSDDVRKTGARPLQYLRRAGWAGTVYPVNPNRPLVQGERAWPSVEALPEVPEHAYVLAGPDAAVEVTRECARLGVQVVTIMADGFVGPDPASVARARALQDIVAAHAVRVVGPSSLGVVNVHERLTLTANAAFGEPDLPEGGVFVASHSGSVIGALVSRGKEMGVGFAGLVSTGGEVDLSLGEICLSTLDDPGVEGYALFLESLAGAASLREFAAAAAERGKPVLAYKLGRSDAGAELSVSHTGALAGDDAVASAFLADIGIGRVDSFEALLEGQQLVRSVPLRPRAARAPRVGVVTTTGGGGAMAVDRLAVAGAVPQRPSEETRRALAERGIAADHGTLVDLTLAGTRYEVMSAALEVMVAAPEFDVVVAVPGSSARFHPDLAVRPIADRAHTGAPLAAFVVPEAPEALRLLRSAGVSAFRTPESCADAIVAAFSRRAPRPAGSRAPAAIPGLPDAAGVLDEVASYAVLDAVGVPHAPFTLLAPGGDVPDVAGPSVVKAVSARLPHKSDAGAVVLDVRDADGVRRAVADIGAALAATVPDVALETVMVAPMVRGLAEVLVGYRRDPDAGPIIVLAAGGVLAELYRDRSVRTAPVDLATAEEMVAEVLALRALAGYRGAARGDLPALARAVVGLSQLAASPRIAEAEANPVMVLAQGRGVVAVDALVRIEEER
ncbi:acetate--CoA ligase family protein [Pseudonocardia sp. MH-G8]|uniref:acetate--CoA ligase family protein n=1 Tax=Pseudonocardia sp. MH-G8 TaxID=1854588 RepID=UPI001E4D2240|nr:acetate--CoA ligase family protein [Pseudonocardia sp. MH-G8]